MGTVTVRYHCDGPDCSRQMTRQERRIAITVEEAVQHLRTIEFDDDGNFGPLPEIETYDMYSDGDFHFCCDTCLTGWAMARALDEAET